jgi:hypothetical protein
VAAFSTVYTSHDLVRPRLTAVLQGEVELAVSTHAMAELYATLTVCFPVSGSKECVRGL